MFNLKVLIVDDEPGMRRGAARTLKKFIFTAEELEDQIGFQITETGTGSKALELISSEEYDIILLDYKLPDVSGLEILSIIKDKKYNALTIMMTAYASLDVAVSATKNGAYDFLAKPFTPEELRYVIRKVATRVVLLRQTRKLESEKRRVRFEFLSVLSHELKAPLNAIESYLKIIDDRVAGNDVDEYDSMLKRSLDRIEGMRKLIFDLLDLTRIESGQKKRKLNKVNITSAANDSIETNRLLAEGKNIEINLDADKEILMTGDNSELEIMFNNLISNAVKYNKNNGEINICIKQNEDKITLEVSDTGIGLKKEEQERLFGEFVRFKNEKTKGIEGSGLGLSILQKLVSLYKGSIEVESEFGIGTKFIINLKNDLIESVL
ncbi:MAG: hybrid sensor histidine kinase/response regulator [bacterium]|nr:hybrid sensor histidine kinase/response regulator [bacterium]